MVGMQTAGLLERGQDVIWTRKVNNTNRDVRIKALIGAGEPDPLAYGTDLPPQVRMSVVTKAKLLPGDKITWNGEQFIVETVGTPSLVQNESFWMTELARLGLS